MPEICRFFHIIIRMYAKEHAPPHFHAFYGDHEAIFSISSSKLMEGKFPKKQEKLVIAWADIYKKELLANWESLTSGKLDFVQFCDQLANARRSQDWTRKLCLYSALRSLARPLATLV